MKALLMSALILLAFNASAACPIQRPGDMPLIPDGAVASDESMHRAQLMAEKYLLQAEAYMDCDVMNRRQYLALAEKVEVFSQLYNDEVIEFRVRTNIVAEK
jgi:hypothetical protein